MKRTKTVAAALSAAMVAAPLAAADISVKSGVFDDVKIWYKGSAGNAIGSTDNINHRTCLVKNLPDMADSTSIQHGGDICVVGMANVIQEFGGCLPVCRNHV